MNAADLHHLIYVSSAVRLMQQQELEEILRASVLNNGLVGVTGMLLYVEGNFMQVLEGPRTSVESVYDRIVGDPRHCDPTLMEFAPVEGRSFPDWNMGFRRVEIAALLRRTPDLALAERLSGSRRAMVRPGVALDLLRSFASPPITRTA